MEMIYICLSISLMVITMATPLICLVGRIEKVQVWIGAKVEHPFRVIKRPFGYMKVRYTA
jgi:hypothetical protein